jgi:hypothetical protein
MIILTAVCWMIMKPFKRMSQTITRNKAGPLNRKARGAQSMTKKAFFTAATGGTGAALGGVGAAADRVSQNVKDRYNTNTQDGEDTGDTLPRPEGRELNQRRRQEVDQSRVEARKTMDRQQRLTNSRKESDLDAAKRDLQTSEPSETDKDNAPMKPRIQMPTSNRGNVIARRLVGSESGPARSSSSVSETWDGGPRSNIAPTKVFTPSSADVSVQSSVPKPITRPAPSTPPRSTGRLWTPSLTSAGAADHGQG